MLFATVFADLKIFAVLPQCSTTAKIVRSAKTVRKSALSLPPPLTCRTTGLRTTECPSSSPLTTERTHLPSPCSAGPTTAHSCACRAAGLAEGRGAVSDGSGTWREMNDGCRHWRWRWCWLRGHLPALAPAMALRPGKVRDR